MSNDYDPYAIPNSTSEVVSSHYPREQQQLADLGKRFLGALIDSFAGVLFCVPGIVVMIMGIVANPEEPGPIFFVGIGLILLGALALLALQIFLMATRSQSIGKYVMKTQMVDVNTGEPASFVSTFLLRGVVNGLIGQIPFVGLVYAIVDILFIFREDHRCLHDLLASTVVIDIS